MRLGLDKVYPAELGTGRFCWRSLAAAVRQCLEKGSQVFVEGELRGDASDGSQNPRIWQMNDAPAGRRHGRAELLTRAQRIPYLENG